MFLPLSLLMNAKVGSVHFWDILTQKWGEQNMTAWSLEVQAKQDWKAVICIRVYRDSKCILCKKNSIWKYTSTMSIFTKIETVLLHFLCQPTLTNFIRIHLAFLILKCGETISSMYSQLCTLFKEHTISNKYTCTSITEIHYFQKVRFHMFMVYNWWTHWNHHISWYSTYCIKISM